MGKVFLVLEEVSEDETCSYPILDNFLDNGSNTRGIIVKFIRKYIIKYKRTHHCSVCVNEI